MLGRSKGNEANYGRDSSSVQQMPRSGTASSAPPEVSISSGLSITGKIVGHGSLTIFGHVEGELHASAVEIAEGAQMEGSCTLWTNTSTPTPWKPMWKGRLESQLFGWV